MAELLNDVDTPSDGELISRVRGGDTAAYGELFSRHRDAANRLARQLVRGPDSDDLVSEAFAKVLTVLQGGGGPDVAFRAYLLTAVRRLHVDRVRSGQRLQTTDDMTPFDPGVPFQDTAVAGFESGAAAKAFASLPERWQLVLWHLEVEGQKPAEVAPLLGMSANSVSALAYRAREGLRQAFLTMHLSDISETDCRWVNEHLGAFVRKGLSKRDSGKVRGHLGECRRCTAMYLELNEVNSNLAGIIAPLLLGAAAAGYLASTSGAGAFGVLSLLSHAKDVAAAHGSGVVAGAVSIGVAAAAVTAIVVTSPGRAPTDVVADGPAARTTAVAPRPSGTPGGPTGRGTPTSAPTTAPTTTLSVAVPTPTLTESPAAVPVAGPVTSPVTSPVAGPATDPVADGVPSAPPDPQPTDTGSGTEPPDDQPAPPPGDAPSEEPGAVPAPERVLGVPRLSGDGFVTLTVVSMRPADVLDLQIASAETTFADTLTGTSCRKVTDRRLACEPGTALLAGDGATPAPSDYGDYTLTVPLAFPDHLVDDEVEVTASIEGAGSSSSGPQAFRPDRPATYDFPPPVVSALSRHDVVGDEDRYDLSTTAVLPPRVRGVRYALTGQARFREGVSPGCVVGDDGTSLSCPELVDGAPVALPLAATSLTGRAEVRLSAAPLAAVADTTPGDQDTTLALRPGADLVLTDLATQPPSASGDVVATATLAGLRPGLGRVTWTVEDGASFSVTGNPGCTAADAASTTLTCPVAAATGGDPATTPVRLALRTDALTTPTAVGLAVTPADAFVAVGAGPHRATTTLRPLRDVSLDDVSETGHGLDGETDRWAIAATVRGLPATVGGATLALRSEPGDGLALAVDQGAGGCALDTSPAGGGQLTCSGLADGDRVTVIVESSTGRAHTAALTIRPVEPFDDPEPANNTVALPRLRPGSHLVLAPQDLGALHRATAGRTAGDYPVSATLTGLRAGLDSVRLTVADGARIVATYTPGCRVADGGLRCDQPSDGDTVAFSVRADDAARATDLVLTAVPGGEYLDLFSDHVARGTLVPSHDFSLGALTETDHTLVAGTDRYTLATQVADLPGDLDAVTLELSDGGVLSADQPAGCDRLGDALLRCDGLADGGRVELRVDSTGTDEHRVVVTVHVPAGYDDPRGDNQQTATTLAPGADLRLAALDPDNESPANDDDLHLVRSHLAGVPDGLRSVDYTLTGDAVFAAVDSGDCTVAGRSATCPDPRAGDVTFSVRADRTGSATPVTVTATPARPYVELDPRDNAAGARLAPRPTYDFSIGTPSVVAQSVSGDTDRYRLRTTARGLPEGLATVGIAVAGAELAPDQPDGCLRSDAGHALCTADALTRSLELDVVSTRTDRRPLRLTLVPPRRYDDPDPADNTATVTVSPGVDLTLGALTPADPVPSATGTYEVTTVLRGTRSGPVRLTVTDATVVEAGCARTAAREVTCADPADGAPVRLVLRPDRPALATSVRVTAAAAAPLSELDPADNAATVRLAPDVSLESLVVTGYRDSGTTTVLRAFVAGTPRGVTTMRVRLSGPGVGLGAGQAHLVDAQHGVNGEAEVTCITSDADGRPLTQGVWGTCTKVDQDDDGHFFIDLRVAQARGTRAPVTFTLVPVGVDEAGRLANNSRSRDISPGAPGATPAAREVSPGRD